MSEQWSRETCPECQQRNWLPELAEDDIGAFKCWSCGKTIRLFDGKHQDEYRPHVDGTPAKYESDESPYGVEWDGLQNPV